MNKNAVFIAFATLILAFIISCSKDNDPTGIGRELNRLDQCLSETKSYDAKTHHRLDSLRSLLRATPAGNVDRRWELTMQIGDQYLAFCSDSSAYFFNRAYNLAVQNGMTSRSYDSRICLAKAQGAAGLFTLANRSLAFLDTTLLSRTQILEYAAAARQLSSYMFEYAKGHSDDESYNMYLNAELKYEQYLINHLSPNAPERKFLYAQHLMRQGQKEQAHKIAEDLLASLHEDDNLYGMTAFLMARIANAEGRDTEYGRYLAMASISDIKAGVKETMALPALAKWLYNKGEVDRAYQYINTSLNDAMMSNARMRTVEIASLLPLVDEAYRKKVSSSRDELMLYLALVVILFVAAGGLLVVVFRNMRRASALNRTLAQQSKVQESYIGHFIGLCSSYSDKLESMRKVVNRKIAAGQTDELLKMLKSGKHTDPENDDFFTVFDETFLDLYPTFLDDLNALLKPECRLSHKKGSPLSTEIRIYAFVRLGVAESVKIAQILHCSVSTIYTYRNRMRGRALNRDTFENDVLSIGTHSIT